MPRPRRLVATSRLSSLAEEPVTNTSMPRVSITRRTSRSHPGTF